MKEKNRETLVRSIAGIFEQFEDDPMETIILSNGKPAVELSFRLELGRKAKQTGEDMLLCGHLDKLAMWQGSPWVIDHKTTKYMLDDSFFQKFSPDNQMSTYNYASKVVFAIPAKGVVINGVQLGVTFTRFQRGFASRSETQLEEWKTDLDYWLSMAEYFATTGYYPQNDKFCSMYGGCQYRSVCGKSPGNSRIDWLKAAYVKRSWDPLKVRGDI